MVNSNGATMFKGFKVLEFIFAFKGRGCKDLVLIISSKVDFIE